MTKEKHRKYRIVDHKEYKILPFNLYIAAMSIFVLIGRWGLIAG